MFSNVSRWDLPAAIAEHEVSHLLFTAACGCRPAVAVVGDAGGQVHYQVPYAPPPVAVVSALAGACWDQTWGKASGEPIWRGHEEDRRHFALAYQKWTGQAPDPRLFDAFVRRAWQVFDQRDRKLVRRLADQLAYERIIDYHDFDRAVGEVYGPAWPAAQAALRGRLAEVLGCPADDLLAAAWGPRPTPPAAADGTPVPATAKAGKPLPTPERRRQLWSELFSAFAEIREEARKSWTRMGRETQNDVLTVLGVSHTLRKEVAPTLELSV